MNRINELIEFLEVMGLWFLAAAKWVLITGVSMLLIALLLFGTIYILKQLNIYNQVVRSIRNFIIG